MISSDEMLSCVLLLREGHYLNDPAVIFVKSRLQLLAVEASKHVDELQLANLRPDIVLSFFNEQILKGPLLDIPGINFHPAPPEYPGRGGAAFALFDGVESYGATAHYIERTVDAGPIVGVNRFALSKHDNCETIFQQAEIEAWRLFRAIVDDITSSGRLPAPCGVSWQRPAIKRSEFEAWLVLDPCDPETMDRKIRAATHSRFPGPYLDIGGHRFTLLRPKVEPRTHSKKDD